MPDWPKRRPVHLSSGCWSVNWEPGTLEQRLEGFAALGIDQVRILRFDAGLAQETARSFIERVLVGELGTWDLGATTGGVRRPRDRSGTDSPFRCRTGPRDGPFIYRAGAGR